MMVMISMEDNILAIGTKFMEQVCSSIVFDDNLKYHLDYIVNKVFGDTNMFLC